MKGLLCPGQHRVFTLIVILMAGSGAPAKAQWFGGAEPVHPQQGGRGQQFRTNTNAAPVLTGTPPATVVAGSSYDFRPGAHDADGDPLTFGILNRPTWLSFDPATGTVAGTAPASAVGIHGEIVITASDGRDTSSLPAFSINVTALQGGTAGAAGAGGYSGSASLSWMPPTENEDGSALFDLAGYHISYGRQPGNYTHRLTIDNPSISTYVVENLAPGTWYFIARAVTYRGIESRDSGIAVRYVR